MLEREPDMKVLGEAKDGRSAARMARELGPDIIVMDVCMPDMNGICGHERNPFRVSQNKGARPLYAR